MNVDVDELLRTIKDVLDKPAFVEGGDDKESLEKIGFTDVRVLTDPVYKEVEACQADEVLILTDLDRAGKRLYSKLITGFTRHGITVDNSLRNLLFRTDLREIEGLYNYLRRHVAPDTLTQYFPHTV